MFPPKSKDTDLHSVRGERVSGGNSGDKSHLMSLIHQLSAGDRSAISSWTGINRVLMLLTASLYIKTQSVKDEPDRDLPLTTVSFRL